MTGVQGLPTKIFSRESPCTKVDIFLCFSRDGEYVKVPVIQARGIIGLNTPKYLIKKGLMYELCQGGIDYWHLSMAGEEWLTAGLARHLELHPEDASRLPGRAGKVSKTATAPRRIMRTAQRRIKV